MRNNWGILDDVLRAYRNAVFEHIATTLERQFGSNWFEDQVWALVGTEEWAELDKNVDQSYASSGLQMSVPPLFERLGVAHVALIVQKHGPRLIVVPGTNSKASPARVAAVVKLAKDVRNVRDPTAHAPTEELPLRDLYFYTELARRVLDSFGLAQKSEDLGNFLSDSGLGSPPALYLDLPPASAVVRHFIGRERELDALSDWLGDDLEPLSVIAGGGGTGKSALAYQFVVLQRQQVSRLNFVLWMSAKRRRLVGGKVEPVEAEFYDDGDVLSRLWRFFGGDGTDTDLPTVMSFLRDTPGLIVADDVDSLDGPGGERAKALLTREIPYRTRTKVLLTSRTQLFGLEKCTVTVPGFKEAEVAEFLRRQLEDSQITVEFTGAQVAALRRATDGVPLYLEDLLRLVLTYDFDNALKQWTSRGGDSAREYALKREFETLTPSAQRVLLAASQYGEPTSALELGAILRLDDTSIGDAIQELQRLFLMSRPSFIEGVPRFSVPSTTSQLVASTFNDELEFKRISSAVDYYRNLVAPSAFERGRLGEIIRTGNLLIRRGNLTEAEQMLNDALRDYPSNPDLLGFKGYLYKHSTPVRFIDTDEAFQTAAVLHCKNPEMYCQWADLHLTKKDYEAAFHAAELGLVECEATTPQLLRLAGVARRDLGNRLYRDMQTEKALQEYERARVHFRGLVETNRGTDARHQLSPYDAYTPYLKLLRAIERADSGADFAREIRQRAAEWLELAPGNQDANGWLAES